MAAQRQPSDVITRLPASQSVTDDVKAQLDRLDGHAESIVELGLGFGPFVLMPQNRALLKEDQPIRLGSRAIDILIALVERGGEIVSKEELLAIAWPRTFVDESNLRVHVASLRKALGDRKGSSRYIVNVAGNGYSFVAPIVRILPLGAVRTAKDDSESASVAPRRIFGRDSAISAVTTLLSTRRLVTIVGPGGAGKSTVALAVRENLLSYYDGRAYVVEFAAVEDPSQVKLAIATAVGVSMVMRNHVNSLVSFLASQRILLLLDNCEHVIEAVAPLVERILREAPDVTILATSREPILVDGECQYRLAGLEAPESASDFSAAEALSYPAVQLFVERATSNSKLFELDDESAATVAEICRQLDGLPLGIELVAARADLFGVRALANDLHERLMLGARRSRTAQPRQQSLRGTLAWSYDLLTEAEQIVLRRFSIFRGPFSLEAATEVASDSKVPVSTVLECLESLTAKSLVVSDTRGATPRFRLLHVTRVFSAEKLLECDETPALARQHAEHYRAILAAAESKWETMARSEWLADLGHTIDDVRAALDWAFSVDGDAETGAALTIAALPFAFQISLIDEFKRRAQLALERLSDVRPANDLAELRLLAALATLSLNATVDPQEVDPLFDRAAVLGEKIGFAKCRIEPLLARAFHRLEYGDPSGAVEIVTRLSEAAQQANDPLANLLADRAAAQVFHFAGDHAHARTLAERVLSHPARVIPLAYSQASIDRRISMRMILARILWIEGFADQAVRLTGECIEMARSDGPFTLTFALALMGCPIALWTGDTATAQSRIDELLQCSRRHTLDRWKRLGECYSSIADRSVDAFGSVDARGPQPASLLQLELLVTIDQRLVQADLADRAQRNMGGWCNPEILRAAGEKRLGEGGPGAHPAAEQLFLAGLEDARRQGALAWELRAATSLARLWRSQNRLSEGHDILEATLARFSEGHGTADLQRADALMSELGCALQGSRKPKARHGKERS